MFKIGLVFLLTIIMATPAFAYRKGSKPSQSSSYSHDSYGRLTRNDNLYRDSDGDGRSNYYDSSDRNSSVW